MRQLKQTTGASGSALPSTFIFLGATPTGLWLADELVNLFGVEERLNGANAQAIYDHLEAQLLRPEFAPRALLDRFDIELLCTTDAATDELAHHRQLHDDGLGYIRPTFRPDERVNLQHPAGVWRSKCSLASQASMLSIMTATLPRWSSGELSSSSGACWPPIMRQ